MRGIESALTIRLKRETSPLWSIISWYTPKEDSKMLLASGPVSHMVN
jgi:hypothetical protein